MDTFALQLFHVNDEEISTSNIGKEAIINFLLANNYSLAATDLAVVEVENDTDALRFQKVSGQIELPAEVFEVAKTNDTGMINSMHWVPLKMALQLLQLPNTTTLYQISYQDHLKSGFIFVVSFYSTCFMLAVVQYHLCCHQSFQQQ